MLRVYQWMQRNRNIDVSELYLAAVTAAPWSSASLLNVNLNDWKENATFSTLNFYWCQLMMRIVQLVVPYSIRDAMEWGGQKARGRLIWHLKCKTQVIRQYRAQAVKDAPCEQAKGPTLENPQALDLLYGYIRFRGLETNGSFYHASSGLFPSAISWPWQMSSNCSQATGMFSPSSSFRELLLTWPNVCCKKKCCQYNPWSYMIKSSQKWLTFTDSIQ